MTVAQEELNAVKSQYLAILNNEGAIELTQVQIDAELLVLSEQEIAAQLKVNALQQQQNNLLIENGGLKAAKASASQAAVVVEGELLAAQGLQVEAQATLNKLESSGTATTLQLATAKADLAAATELVTAAESKQGVALTRGAKFKAAAAAAGSSVTSGAAGGGSKFLKLVGGGSVGGGIITIGVAGLAGTYLALKKHAEDLNKEAKEVAKMEQETTDSILKNVQESPALLEGTKVERAVRLESLRVAALSRESFWDRLAQKVSTSDTEAQLLEDQIAELEKSDSRKKAIELISKDNVMLQVGQLRPKLGKPTGNFEDAQGNPITHA